MELGNIFPGERVKIDINVIQPLSSEDGSFNFVLPLSYFPKLIDSEEKKDEILFNFKASIISPNKKVT